MYKLIAVVYGAVIAHVAVSGIARIVSAALNAYNYGVMARHINAVIWIPIVVVLCMWGPRVVYEIWCQE